MERKFVRNNKRGSKLNFIQKKMQLLKYQNSNRKRNARYKGSQTISCKLEI